MSLDRAKSALIRPKWPTILKSMQFARFEGLSNRQVASRSSGFSRFRGPLRKHLVVSIPVHSALSAICLYIVSICRVTSEPCCPWVAQQSISVCRQRTYMPDRACCVPDKEFLHASEYFGLPGREFVCQTEHAGDQQKAFQLARQNFCVPAKAFV